MLVECIAQAALGLAVAQLSSDILPLLSDIPTSHPEAPTFTAGSTDNIAQLREMPWHMTHDET